MYLCVCTMALKNIKEELPGQMKQNSGPKYNVSAIVQIYSSD